MAGTRFFLPSTGAPPVSPSFDAGWEDTTSVPANTGKPVRLSAVTAKSSTALTTWDFQGTSPGATNADLLYCQYVSDPLVGGQVIGAQNLSIQALISEVNTIGTGLFLTVGARLVKADGTDYGSPKTICAVTRDATEAAQTLTNRSLVIGTTSQTTADGDRLVIEIGLGGSPSSNHKGAIQFGDTGATDLPVDDIDTTTTKVGWVEFSSTVLTFLVTKSSGETGTGTDAHSLAPAVTGGESGAGTDAGSISATPSSSDTGAGTDTNAPYSPTALPWAKYRPSHYGWRAGTGKHCTISGGPGDSISSLFNAQDGGTSARYIDGYVPYIGNGLQALRQVGGSAKPSIYVPAMMPKNLGVEVWPEGTNPWTDVGTTSIGQDGQGGLMEAGVKMNGGGRSIVVPTGYTHVIIQYAWLTGTATLTVKYDGSTIATDVMSSGTQMRQLELALGSDNKVLDIRCSSLTNILFTGVIFEDRTGANGSLRTLTAGHGGWGADTWAHPVASPVGVQSGDTGNLWAQCQALLDVDLTVLFLGPNDARHDSSGMPGVDDSATFGTDLTAIVTTLDAAFAAAGKVKPDLFFVAYPYIDGTIGDPTHAYSSTVWAAYVAAMATVAASYGTRAQFLDLGTKFGPLDGNSAETSSVDHFHPNALGHSKIAQAMIPYLAQLPIVTSSESGTGTDAVGKIAVSSSETGAGTEGQSVNAGTVTISSSETGTGTDAATLIALATTDSGAGSDTGTITAQVAASQSATATDTGALAPAVTSAESGTGTDAGALVPTVQSGETGTGSENGSIVVAQTASESGAGTETMAIAATTSNGETATGNDSWIVLAVPAQAETGTGTDSGALVAPVTSSETGALTDAGTLVAQPASAESGAATESGTAGIAAASSETGTGTDDSTVSIELAGAETGTLIDDGLVTALLSSSEQGVGVDAGTFVVHLASAEFALGSELATAITVALSAAESGVGVMNGLLLVLQTLIVIRRRYELEAASRHRLSATTRRVLTARTIHRI